MVLHRRFSCYTKGPLPSHDIRQLKIVGLRLFLKSKVPAWLPWVHKFQALPGNINIADLKTIPCVNNDLCALSVLWRLQVISYRLMLVFI